MPKKFKVFIGISLIFVLGIMLGGCESNPTNGWDIVENFTGSGGPGDFYKVEINISDKTLEYDNLTTGENSQENFVEQSSNLFKIDDTTYFAKLNDEIIVIGDESMDDGEGLMTALKETESDYGEEIGGIYNVATSAEGWVGTVEIKPDKNEVEVKLDTDYNGSFDPYDESKGFEQETLPTMSYTYNEAYSAIEINESEKFKHYGVFADDQLGVFDSYMWDETAGDWIGDGMFVLVKQDSNVDLAEYVGDYFAVDIDGTINSFGFVYESGVLEIIYEGNPTGVTIDSTNEVLPGVFEFDFDGEAHRMIVLPGKAMVVAYEGIAGDGKGIFVGVKAD